MSAMNQRGAETQLMIAERQGWVPPTGVLATFARASETGRPVTGLRHPIVGES